MEKICKAFEMHHPNGTGTFEDVYKLYKWLGVIDTSSAGHKFTIEVKIHETIDDKLV